MPTPRSTHTDYYRQGAYSPPSSTYTDYDDRYDDRYDSYPRGNAVQPYYPADRRDRAMKPYDYSDSPRRPVARRRSDSYLGASETSRARSDSKRDQAQDWFKDHGAELLGAAAGGFAGHKAGRDPLKTAGGAAVGAIGGKIVNSQYQKWSDKRENEKVGHNIRREVSPGYEEPARYSRSAGRHRSRSRRDRSASRGRDRSPSTWKDLGRQIRRELSRKGEKSRARSPYSDYSR